MWSTGEGNGKPLQYSCLQNPMNSMRRQNDRILKEELPDPVSKKILRCFSETAEQNTSLWPKSAQRRKFSPKITPGTKLLPREQD